MSNFFKELTREILKDMCYAGISKEVLIMRARMNAHLLRLLLPCIGFPFSYNDELEEKTWQNKSMEAL